jgi:tRNA 2-thiouridine synthesizing protein A
MRATGRRAKEDMMDKDASLDTRGLSCPMPILKTAMKIKELEPGQVLEVLGDDPGTEEDLPAWCEQTGHGFLGMERAGDYDKYYVKKTA